MSLPYVARRLGLRGTPRAIALAAVFAVGFAPLALTEAAAAVPATPAAVSASTGEMGIDPPAGRVDLANVALITTAKCPSQATHYLVSVTGAGFAENSNAVGNTDVSMIELPPGGQGMFIRVYEDWQSLALDQDAKLPLNGVATLKLICGDLMLHRHDLELTTQIKFAPPSKSDPAGSYTQVGGPQVASGRTDLPIPGLGGTPRVGEWPKGTHRVSGEQGRAMAGAATVRVQTLESEGKLPAGSAPAAVGGSDIKSDSPAESGISSDQGATSQVASSGRSRGASHTPLYIGLIIALAAAAGGFAVFRRRPSEYSSI